MYILHREQVLETTVEEAWNFLSNPYNLNRITPPELHFQILSSPPEEMYAGLIIEYQITIPVIGKNRWITEIKHIRPNRSFVDEQRVGPYSLWYHLHEITAIQSRVKSCDTVYYRPPFGPIGKLLHATFIRRQLDRIFDYRGVKLDAIFNSSGDDRP